MKLSELNEYERISLGGYDWIVWISSSGARSLNPTGEKPLDGCRINEDVHEGSGNVSYVASMKHPTFSDLQTPRREFPTLEDAVAWATTFQWNTRKIGSLTWFAVSDDADSWFATIGPTEANIYRSPHGKFFTVTRTVQFGLQRVKFEIQDMAFGPSKPKSIESFEQASAIALTMSDYVLELMRNVD